ncbi:60S ribosomal protein L13a [Amphibalanus amphitrite]|uniref:Large ribosomal subunit protein uL13 n=1 Tax=Amphibalanus amphitrite TaxID=1232801 RepID=A0A6A4WZ49_AMPAM|nr:60S ribosomal protein L13a [Amphibalanus amphitrite]
MLFQAIVVDGSGHLLGRLGAVVAKALLNGDKVVVLKCEEINISGSFFRNKMKYMEYLRKRCNVNPARGPFHFRAPSMMLRRVIRGMLPHKTRRGGTAMLNLRCVEGVPREYQKLRRMVVPSAMRKMRLRPGRPYCELGRLGHEVGWKYQDVVKTLEARRRVRDRLYAKKMAGQKAVKARALRQVSKQLAPIEKEMASLGCVV